jgi:myo-inositol 2-dehydrogenase/D-chiro-inositol 1-dehydrogenase
VQALKTEGKVTLWAMADAFSKRVEESLGKIRRELERDSEAESPGTLAEQVNVPPERQFAGLNAYQQAIDSGVDLVILATPPGFRPMQFEAAINAGKHVFTEKPLAVDAPGIRRVLAAGKMASEKDLVVGVGLQRHHDPAYIETIQRLQDGAIGDIPLTRVYWNGGGVWVRTRADFAKTYGHEPTEMEYQVNNWYYFNWLCGDHIVEQHIHNLDVSNWLKDAHPIQANGMGGREVRTSNEYGQIFDHHSVEFTYADGSTMMSQCRHQQGCWSPVDEYATGCSGSAHFKEFQIISPSGEWKYSGPRVDPYQQEHDELFAAIRRGEPGKLNDGDWMAKSTLLAVMGREAAYTGQTITWDQALNSEQRLGPEHYGWGDAPEVAVAIPGRTKFA